MAQKIGTLIRERRGSDSNGKPRYRHGFVVWVTSSSGLRERKRIYSGADDTGTRTVFATRKQALAHLNVIRQRVAGGATVEAAIAPYLVDREGDLVRVAWEQFVNAHELATREYERPVTAERLRELRRMTSRGYLDFFASTYVQDLSPALLAQWLDWLRKHWPAPPAGSPRGRIKPTPEQRAAGIRGFHRAKMRHHVVGDFLQFDGWLVAQHRVHPRMHALAKPKGMPPLPKGGQPVPDADTLRRYLDAIPEELRGLFLARSYDGLRPSEARRMNVADFDFRSGVLRIDVSDTKTAEGAAPMLLDWEVREWLDRYVPKAERLDRTRPLFRNPRALTPASRGRARAMAAKRGVEAVVDGRWTESAEKGAHDAACRAIGVYFPPNIFGRHAAGTHMLQRSKERTGAHDIDAVRRKLRHRHRATTERYVDREVIECAIVERLPPRPPTAGDAEGTGGAS